jgi:hypothetical protein
LILVGALSGGNKYSICAAADVTELGGGANTAAASAKLRFDGTTTPAAGLLAADELEAATKLSLRETRRDNRAKLPNITGLINSRGGFR